MSKKVSALPAATSVSANDYLMVVADPLGTATSKKITWTNFLASLPVVASITRGTFTNADLSAGVLTITHNKALSSPYTVLVAIYNNSGAQIIPDAVNTLATNSFKVDLTSFGVISGTWSYAYST